MVMNMNRNPLAFALNTLCWLVALILLATDGRRALGDEPDVPKPAFDRIDYAKPKDYLDLPASLGDRDRIRKIAAGLKRESPEDTLVAISRWLEKNLRYNEKCAYAWRNFNQIVDDGEYGGCADHSIVFGALTRACGIPCVWVKTMDIDWIREFKAN
jgi:transglutaminase-like putative cysteine protease